MEIEAISLRLATQEDMCQIFEWRNHENTRRYFFNPAVIAWKDHVIWFNQILQDANRHLLIASYHDFPIGVMRLDCEKDQAEVDVYVSPGQAGQGYGTLMLKTLTGWTKQNLPSIQKLMAKVFMDNKASLKAFEKAGFIASYQIFEKRLHEKN